MGLTRRLVVLLSLRIGWSEEDRRQELYFNGEQRGWWVRIYSDDFLSLFGESVGDRNGGRGRPKVASPQTRMEITKGERDFLSQMNKPCLS